MKYLSQCKIGETVVVVGFDNKIDKPIKKRLFQLGILEGTHITFVQKSVLNKVVLLEVNFYTLSLRSDIAKLIEVRSA